MTMIARTDADHADGIAVDGASVVYPGGVVALRDVSFTLPRATICGLVGINGSGKSTLFKALMGFATLASGSILLMGKPVDEALKTNLVAYVPQSEDVDWNFPVLVQDVVMMGRYGHMNALRIPRRADKDAVRNALSRVGMSDYAKRQIGQLSGGQKKRVFVARALAQGAKIILLDEPFTGVDVKTETAIVTLLREMRDAGCVILVSTHNLGSVPAFCDEVVLINKTVLAAGITRDVFTPKNLERAFGGALRQFTLEGDALHDDDDPRQLTVLSDDESPLVLYGEGHEVAGLPPKDGNVPDKQDGER